MLYMVFLLIKSGLNKVSAVTLAVEFISIVVAVTAVLFTLMF